MPFTENKSILTDNDWKKLWKEAGNLNPNSKTDNSIDSSDSPVFEDTEVSGIFFFYLRGSNYIQNGNDNFFHKGHR